MAVVVVVVVVVVVATAGTISTLNYIIEDDVLFITKLLS